MPFLFLLNVVGFESGRGKTGRHEPGPEDRPGTGGNMKDVLLYLMIYAGSALMAYNIYGYICFSRDVRKHGNWIRNKSSSIFRSGCW